MSSGTHLQLIVGLDEKRIDQSEGQGPVVQGLKPPEGRTLLMVEEDVAFILGKPEDAGRHVDHLVFPDMKDSKTGGFNLQDVNYSFP